MTGPAEFATEQKTGSTGQDLSMSSVHALRAMLSELGLTPTGESKVNHPRDVEDQDQHSLNCAAQIRVGEKDLPQVARNTPSIPARPIVSAVSSKYFDCAQG